ncbi:MAG: folate-binding protein YgfZ [Thiomargarita sp.]|nr:folate-binding protein YgfZ [Thiomargarita sp.]
MNNNMWKQYLQEIGAQIENNIVVSFGQAKAELQQVMQGDIIADLSHFGLIKVTGKDASIFLQGQFTNNVLQVTATKHQLTAFCTHQGRILMSFRLFKRQAAYYLLLPKENVNAIIKRLQMYVLRSDVQLTIAEDLFCLGVAGKNITKTLSSYLNQEISINDSLTIEDTTFLRISDLLARYLIISPNVQNLWQYVETQAHKVGSNAWQLLDILAGLPQITTATSEAFIPQMINFDVIDGINFKKGCYTGQEIVARVQYLGEIKRRMYLARIENELVPKAGDIIYNEQGENVGKIVNAAPYPESESIVLVVMQVSQVKQTAYWQIGETRKILNWLNLPYQLPVKLVQNN